MDPRTNDEISTEIAQQIALNNHDRSFYEKAIQTCRARRMLEDLDIVRIAFCERLVMKPGNVMEWIADNALYEDNLSEERLGPLKAACEDVYNINCWLKLLELARSSSNLSTNEKIEIYRSSFTSLGCDLSSGFKVRLDFLEFLDEAENISEAETLEVGTIIGILSIPFVSYKELYAQLTADYGLDIVHNIVDIARSHHEEVGRLESLCADPEAKKDVYLELCQLLKSIYPELEGSWLVEALYKRWLSRHPEDTRTWLYFIKQEIPQTDERVLTVSRLARRSNPSDVALWIDELHQYVDSTVNIPEMLVPGHQRPLSLESAKEYTIEYVTILLRRSRDDPSGKLNWSEFVSKVKSLAANLAGHPELQSSALIFLASLEAKLLNRSDIFSEIEPQFGDQFHYWFEKAKCHSSFDAATVRQCFERAASLCKVLNAQFLDTWLEFEHVYGMQSTYNEAYDKIMQLRYKLHREAPKRSEYQEKIVAEKIEAKRPRVEEAPSIPLVVDLAPRAELSVHVANIDFHVIDAQLRDFFQEHVGPVQTVQIGRKANGESRGFASVEFKEATSVHKALSLDRTRLNGRPLFISRHQTVGGASWKPAVSHPRGRDPCTLYVSQLPGDTTEDDLNSLFTPYGIIKGIRLGLEKDGRCKGYAYVEFEDEQTASKALAEHGKIVKGQAISVLISDPSLAPKKQTQKMAMVPPSLSRPKPKSRLNLS